MGTIRKEFKYSVIEFLVNSLNVDQFTNLARDFSPRFDVNAETGFEKEIRVPLRVAVESFLTFLGDEIEILDFISFLFSREGHGAGSGGIVHLQGKNRLLQNLGNDNWIYKEYENVFEKDQRREKTQDWGVMRENQTYAMTFASLDIVSSSELIKRNDLKNIEETLHSFKQYVKDHVEDFDGRVWIWSGDGGLAAFHGPESTVLCLQSMVSILAYLPHFNISLNRLIPESDIKVRIAVHAGLCNYKRDTTLLACGDIDAVNHLQENFAKSNTLLITGQAVNRAPPEMSRFFKESEMVSGYRLFHFRVE